MSKKLNVCVILDECSGENSILNGILHRITKHFDTNVSYLKIKSTNKSKSLRRITRIFMQLGFIPKRFFSYYISKISIEGELKDADILICRNTQSSFIARAYQVLYGRTFTICWNRASGYPKSSYYFDTIVRYNTKTLKTKEGSTTTLFETGPVFPVKITKEDMAVSAKNSLEKNNLQLTPGKQWALLLGGNCAEFSYSESDLDPLICAMRQLSLNRGIRWLITTSPRTPKTWADTLSNELEEHMDHLVDYNQKPEHVVAAYLGLSDVICVTEDSASMICESIASSKPTVVITTEQNNKNRKSEHNQNPNRNHAQVVSNLIKLKHVQHCLFNNLHLETICASPSNIYESRMNELEQTLIKQISDFPFAKNHN